MGVNIPKPLPVKVKLGDIVTELNAILFVNAVPLPAQVKVPAPEASNVALSVPTVNKRSVDWEVVPTNLSVPPLITRLVATFVACPIPLAVPPFASVDTERIPPLMVVIPV